MVRVTDKPLYKLSTVLEITGLKADVVRAWERRYGLPCPRRTSGGHRLYTQRDIHTLQWLQARQAEGLRISQAVQLWRELEAAGQDPLAEVPKATSPLEEARLAWLRAGLDFDEAGAAAALQTAFAVHPLETVLEQVLQHGLQELGERWYRGEISAQQEHFLSELAMRHLHHLMAATPVSTQKGRLLIGTPPGEHHALPALLLAVRLRWRGWDVVYLGTDIPLEHLQEALKQVQPSAVLYSAQLLSRVPALQATAQQLSAAGVPLGYGGKVFNRFPRLRERIPAFFLGETLTAALEEVELLTHMSLRFSTPPPVEPKLQRAAEALRLHTARITAQVQEQSAPYGVGAQEAAFVVTFLHEQAEAALRLGDLTPLHAERRWVEGWLHARRVDDEGIAMLWRRWEEALVACLGDDIAAPLLGLGEAEGETLSRS